MTRWQQLYLDDERVLSAPPSTCARYALEYFQRARITTIRDLGCGVGRDTRLFMEHGLWMVGLEAAASGLDHARGRNQTHSNLLGFIQADARGIPHVQNYTQEMFDRVTAEYECL